MLFEAPLFDDLTYCLELRRIASEGPCLSVTEGGAVKLSPGEVLPEVLSGLSNAAWTVVRALDHPRRIYVGGPPGSTLVLFSIFGDEEFVETPHSFKCCP